MTTQNPSTDLSRDTSPKAMSLHIGLNAVDPAHYDGWSGPLTACEFDAKDMDKIAKSSGMKPTMLLTRDATRAKTLAAIRDAAKQLTSGDFFFMSYSGHGGQVDDVGGEERDKLDETWCLYDGQLIDDEMFLELTKFPKGVRVLVLSDSCHSGTVVRAKPAPNSKMMPPDVARRVYMKHKEFYDGLQTTLVKAAEDTDPDQALSHVDVSRRLGRLGGKCKAAVILISGCQDNQTSLDGAQNGAFTEQLLKVWNKGAYKGTYREFYSKIKSGMPYSQTPNLFQMGHAGRFAKQQPFEV